MDTAELDAILADYREWRDAVLASDMPHRYALARDIGVAIRQVRRMRQLALIRSGGEPLRGR